MQAIKYIAHPLAGAPHATEIVLGAAVKLAAIVGKEGFAEAVECQQRRAKVVGDQVAESFELSVDRSERGGPLLDQVLELVSIAAQLLLRPIQLHKNSDLGPKDRRHNWRKDEIHSAKLIPTPRVGLALVERCHEDDRRQLGLRPLPDELGGLEPVHVRHADIQENDGELRAQEPVQSAELWSSNLVEQVDVAAYLLIPAAFRAENQRFLLAEREVSGPNQAVVEETVRALLKAGPEVDQNVGAQDQVKLIERAVADQVVARPGDVPLELSMKARRLAGDRVKVRDPALAA